MGRAEILQHLGEAKYRIRALYDRRWANRRLTQLQARVSAAQARVPPAQAAHDQAVQELDQATQDAVTALQELQANPDDPTVRTRWEQAKKRYDAALAREIETASALARARLEQASAERALATYQAQLPADPELDAWCADYTTDLVGEVGTIEVARVGSPVIIVRPGYGGGAAWDRYRDGQLQPVMGTSPEAAYYNYAMLPGAARWRPLYRVGEVTAVDVLAGTLDVALDPARSGHQGLETNQASALQGVPVEYMGTVDAGVFSPGDRVVVRFDEDPADLTGGTSWSRPAVIGFAEYPRPIDAALAPFWVWDGVGFTPFAGTEYSQTAVPPYRFELVGYGTQPWHVGFEDSTRTTTGCTLVSTPTPDNPSQHTFQWPAWSGDYVPQTDPADPSPYKDVILISTDSVGQQVSKVLRWPLAKRDPVVSADHNGKLSLADFWPGWDLESIPPGTYDEVAWVYEAGAPRPTYKAWIFWWQQANGDWMTAHSYQRLWYMTPQGPL